MTTSFQDALRTGSLETLRTIPKSDLHNHAYAGGNRAWVSRVTGRDIAPLDRQLNSMAEMHAWVDRQSNVMLGRVRTVAEHPIRRLFDAGVIVTVNTDDVLVFGQGVSEEFLGLFQAGLFNADELEFIRLSGLTDPARQNRQVAR